MKRAKGYERLLLAVFEQKRLVSPYDTFVKGKGQEMINVVDGILNLLIERDARNAKASRNIAILKLRFGLDTGEGKTLKEVGEEFNLTGERVREIGAKILRRLRHPQYSRSLKQFLLKSDN